MMPDFEATFRLWAPGRDEAIAAVAVYFDHIGCRVCSVQKVTKARDGNLPDSAYFTVTVEVEKK